MAKNQGQHLCECGCGERIWLKPEHYPHAPRFVHHHHTPVPRKPPPEPTPCECGCGALAMSGRRFVTGHNGRGTTRSPEARAKMSAAMSGERNHRYGKRAPNYKGRIIRADGYVMNWVPEHPFASNGRVMEHRLVVEAYLRETEPDSSHLVRLGNQLYLRPEIVVHHIDGVKGNNEPTNLAPMTNSEHTTVHRVQGDIY